MRKYFIFRSLRASLGLVGFTALCMVASIYRLCAPAAMPVFAQSPWASYYAYIMEAITFAVLATWIARSTAALERSFLALWLCASFVAWLGPAYPAWAMLAARFTDSLLWMLANIVGVGIMIDIRRSKECEPNT